PGARAAHGRIEAARAAARRRRAAFGLSLLPAPARRPARRVRGAVHLPQARVGPAVQGGARARRRPRELVDDRRHPRRRRGRPRRGLPHRADRQRQRDRMGPRARAAARQGGLRPVRGRGADRERRRARRPRSRVRHRMRRLPWTEAKNVLAVRLDNIGDVLMTTPAIRALKESVPGRRITLLTSPAGAQVAPYVREVDHVIAFAAPWMKATGEGETMDGAMIVQLASKSFDAAVVFTVYSQNPLPAAYLTYLAGIPVRLAHCRENPYRLLTDWVPEPEPEKGVRHEVRRQLDLVAAAGASTDDERLSFTLPQRVREQTRRTLVSLGVESERPLVVAHPGASAASRRYPPEMFARALR